MGDQPLLEAVPPGAGELVAGKYQLVRLIGQGGMGSVWEGRHLALGTRVACKFIDADFASRSPEARTRFRNEARAAASLRSKHVVDVYDYGVMTDGRPYLVMEYLVGESLAERLHRTGRLPLGTTARIVHQVGRALQKAHAAGIVHRDLKPDNIFLMWDEDEHEEQVKVVDFGIAKFTDERVNVSHATQTGSVLGTPYFMSPEQARGIGPVDHRSDLWALGVVAFHCLTGQLPFYSEAVGDLLVRICTGDIPVPSHLAPDLPLAIDAWMARALERDKDLRFQSAREMTEALSLALGPIARPMLESFYDEDGGAGRLSLHLTAGPRMGQLMTGSLPPPGPRESGFITAIGIPRVLLLRWRRWLQRPAVLRARIWLQDAGESFRGWLHASGVAAVWTRATSRLGPVWNWFAARLAPVKANLSPRLARFRAALEARGYVRPDWRIGLTLGIAAGALTATLILTWLIVSFRSGTTSDEAPASSKTVRVPPISLPAGLVHSKSSTAMPEPRSLQPRSTPERKSQEPSSKPGGPPVTNLSDLPYVESKKRTPLVIYVPTSGASVPPPQDQAPPPAAASPSVPAAPPAAASSPAAPSAPSPPPPPAVPAGQAKSATPAPPSQKPAPKPSGDVELGY